ncbi:UDP-N-acetylglucosamine--N-acetylmuramyl-(pentapeptide) pyrophosphoryl-undecaprenol N-acetylglucosamine transferase [Paenarthrobacter nicotinovorans]|uniref:undecaprenyldiphospho-muramoylpentapeptide beta-N-acetylglucosaminyltransferase n=1 Tax=Micrococcaceae TaxID=1268 RepID=UPI00047E101A|nr:MULTISPECIES: undecaprenyldiphospho-muramoylpentapeptide beta-N-acetylglucosaminyltransferase [Micrococcaceae]MDR6439132.1 UDP-N-acetylglucosamine--N-acetylmuramyl-(pentapeptide) pyrophosphoryl-undecaprenol N-acetylglucosamine transferase [Paenarthrobacter nicotinovorans]SCZ65474.1 UDP-N-acetylglucosamine-N-acetylmuramylpentapeptide N-acetylglucosamine transferase [Arthrobacter sp. UNCCL28]
MTPDSRNASKPLSVVLAGGGTAGHVSPLLAIADAIKDKRPEAAILAVGTPSGMETRLIPAAGYELATIDRVPFPRRPSVDLIKLPGRLRSAVSQARRILEDAKADVLVGVGGYVCTPMYLAARKLGIPVVIHEANMKAGLANRVGARFSNHVAVAFAGTRLRGARHVGMPMRRAISGLHRAQAAPGAKEALGLDPDRPALIVTGGSSGALSINRSIAAALPALAAAGIQTLHITGNGKAVLDDHGTLLAAEGYRQVEYVDGMENVYAAADVLLARAGAGTVSEVAAVGVPAVFVPLPIGNGEQALNAAPLVNAGGALLVEDKDLNPEWLERELIPLISDRKRLEDMAAKSEALGIRNADQRMADLVLEAVSA